MGSNNDTFDTEVQALIAGQRDKELEATVADFAYTTLLGVLRDVAETGEHGEILEGYMEAVAEHYTEHYLAAEPLRLRFLVAEYLEAGMGGGEPPPDGIVGQHIERAIGLMRPYQRRAV